MSRHGARLDHPIICEKSQVVYQLAEFRKVRLKLDFTLFFRLCGPVATRRIVSEFYKFIKSPSASIELEVFDLLSRKADHWYSYGNAIAT
jgi:hypothetical protein